MSVALFAVLIAGFVVSAGAIAVPLWRGPRQVREDRDELAARNETDAEIQVTVDELTEIEAEYAGGYLARDEYSEEKRRSGARLRLLHRRQKSRNSILERAIDARAEALKSGSSTPLDFEVAEPTEKYSERVSAEPREAPTRRKTALIGVFGLIAVGFVIGVIALVSSGRAATPQAPVAEVVLADYRSLVAFGGRAIDGLLLSHESGIHLSGDGGRNWSAVQSDSPINSLAVSPGTVYIGTRGLFAATDLESNWREITPPGGSGEILAVAVSPADFEVIAVVDSAGAVFVSSDAGGSWERLPLAAPVSTRSLTIMPTHGLMFLGTTDQGVLAGDGRERWTSANGFVNGALPTVRSPSVVYDPLSGDSFEGVNGRFEGALYAGTDLGLFKSVDGGMSWNRLALDIAVEALAVGGGAPRTITAVDGRGRVFRSDDRGLSWDFGAR